MMSILQQNDPPSDEEISITQKKKKGKKTTKKGEKGKNYVLLIFIWTILQKRRNASTCSVYILITII